MRAARGFNHFTLVEFTNDCFNLTVNVPTLVLGDVIADLTTLANTYDILDTVDPATAHVEEIRNLQSISMGAQLAKLTIGRYITPQ